LSDTEIEVSWTDNAQNEDEFRIEREAAVGAVAWDDPAFPGVGVTRRAGTGSSGPSRVFGQVGTVGPNVTQFHDTGLAPGNSYRYRVLACNGNGCSEPGGNQGEATTYSTLAIETTDLAHGSLGEAYQAVLLASGGDGAPSWSVTGGALPSGITLSTAGVLSGVPTQTGAFLFTVTAVGGGQSVSRALSLAIHGVLAITSGNLLPDGVRGDPYATPLQASGGDGTYAWALIAGALPPGLAMDGSGVVSGTPTASGISTFTVEVSSGGQSVAGEFVLRVYDPLEITTGPLPQGRQGTAYIVTLTATGGNGLYAWSLTEGDLPDGLTLDPASGSLAGTPTAVGVFPFTAQVSSGGKTGTKAFSITVTPALVINTTSLPSGRLTTIYTQFLSASGGDGTFTWSIVAGALPNGLSLHSTNGVITGTPNTVGEFFFTVQVASGGYTATADLSIGVYSILSIATTSIPSGSFGQPYTSNLSAMGGDGNYTWTLTGGTLPQGVSLASDGTISGTPTWMGTFNFSVRVNSGDGQSANKGFTITIN